MSRYLKSPMYSNCVMMSPEGNIMCRMSKKRATWYVNKNLAKVVNEDPYTIQLTFKPNGLGHCGDSYYIGQKENRCVVCGSYECLTKHHSVPYRYRKHFPHNLKRSNSYDILPLCNNCHETYEFKALEFRRQMAHEVGLLKLETKEKTVDLQKRVMLRHAKTLLLYRHQMPAHAIEKIKSLISEYLGHEVTEEDLVELSSKKQIFAAENLDGKIVVEHVMKNGLNALQDFTWRWRRHFVDTMQPKFLPQHWIVEKELDLSRLCD